MARTSRGPGTETDTGGEGRGEPTISKAARATKTDSVSGRVAVAPSTASAKGRARRPSLFADERENATGFCPVAFRPARRQKRRKVINFFFRKTAVYKYRLRRRARASDGYGFRLRSGPATRRSGAAPGLDVFRPRAETNSDLRCDASLRRV